MGETTRPAVEKLRLSDAFTNEDRSGEFEWTATVMNLNHQENRKFLEKCGILLEYTDFVKAIRESSKSMEQTEAVDRVVKEYIAGGGELAEILLEHRAEVVDMLLTEFDEEAFVRDIREEGREEGRNEGRREGREEGLRTLVASLKQFVCSPQELYQIVTANECYKELTFEKFKKML